MAKRLCGVILLCTSLSSIDIRNYHPIAVLLLMEKKKSEQDIHGEKEIGSIVSLMRI